MSPRDESDITYEGGKYEPEDLSGAPEGDDSISPVQAELQE